MWKRDSVCSGHRTGTCSVRYAGSGKLPLRVTHNDTKLNNIMIDNATEKPSV